MFDCKLVIHNETLIRIQYVNFNEINNEYLKNKIYERRKRIEV
jgi:hypothetical protein